MPSEELPYYDELMGLINQGNYFSFNRKYVTVLGLNRQSALFLQDLINHYSMPNTVRDEDFFLCTVAYLQASLNWSKDTQADLIKSLKKRGYVETEDRGMPKRRWIKVNLQTVLEDLKQNSSSDREKSITSRREKSITSRREKSITSRREKSIIVVGKTLHKEVSIEQVSKEESPVGDLGATAPRPRRDDQAPTFAGKLSREIYRKLKDKNLVMRTPRLGQWEVECCRLVKDIAKRNGIEVTKAEEYVADVLTDHIENIKDPYQPQRFSLPEMAKDFLRIESARNRRTTKTTRKKFRTVKSDDGRERRVYEDDPEYNDYYDPDEEYRNRKPIGYFPSGKPQWSIYQQEDDED